MLESQRVVTLNGYGVLDSPNEPEFDIIVREAARLCAAPMALISLVDENRQWFKAKVGLEPRETPRSISFCTHAIEQGEPMVIEDAASDARFADNPLVTGSPHIRFYAGAPLRARNGARVGTLCVIDRTPRELPPSDLAKLVRLADRVIDLLEERGAFRMTKASCA